MKTFGLATPQFATGHNEPAVAMQSHHVGSPITLVAGRPGSPPRHDSTPSTMPAMCAKDRENGLQNWVLDY